MNPFACPASPKAALPLSFQFDSPSIRRIITLSSKTLIVQENARSILIKTAKNLCAPSPPNSTRHNHIERHNYTRVKPDATGRFVGNLNGAPDRRIPYAQI